MPKSRTDDGAGPARSLAAGLTATVSMTVTDEDTAESLGTGDVPVLGTPRLVALCEEACCRVIDGRTDEGVTSVASRVRFEHLAPVSVGDAVIAEATLKRVEGRRLIFTVCGRTTGGDDGGLVGAGLVTRVLVDREKFLSKAAKLASH